MFVALLLIAMIDWFVRGRKKFDTKAQRWTAPALSYVSYTFRSDIAVQARAVWQEARLIIAERKDQGRSAAFYFAQ